MMTPASTGFQFFGAIQPPSSRFSSFRTRLLLTAAALMPLLAPAAHADIQNDQTSAPTSVAPSSIPNDGYGSLTSIAAGPAGYWVQRDTTPGGDRPRTVPHDGATDLGSVDARGQIAAIPPKNSFSPSGYWVIGAQGVVHARGVAEDPCNGHLKNCTNYPSVTSAGDRVVGATAHPDGKGFWVVTFDGSVYTVGSAVHYGDAKGSKWRPTGIAATPHGSGYYIVTAGGEVFARNATHFGQMDEKPNRKDVTGIAVAQSASGDAMGYWLVDEAGGVHAKGDGVPMLGSTGGNSQGITGIATRNGRSYAWVHDNGRIEHSGTWTMKTLTSSAFGTELTLPTAGSWDMNRVQLSRHGEGGNNQWDMWPTTADEKIVQIVSAEVKDKRMCLEVDGNVMVSTVQKTPCKGKLEGWDSQRFHVAKDLAGETHFIPVGKNGVSLQADSSGALKLGAIGGLGQGWKVKDVPPAEGGTAGF